jgi:hypothetical protein
MVTHDVYRFELPSHPNQKTQKLWRRNKIRSGNFALLARCSLCYEIRPLDALANQWLYDVKAISQSEYLSWAQ